MDEMPVNLFIILLLFLVGCIYYTVRNESIYSIFSGTLSITLSFMLSKIAINGTLIEPFDTGNVTIHNAALSYLLMFVGVIMSIITALFVLEIFRHSISSDDSAYSEAFE